MRNLYHNPWKNNCSNSLKFSFWNHLENTKNKSFQGKNSDKISEENYIRLPVKFPGRNSAKTFEYTPGGFFEEIYEVIVDEGPMKIPEKFP